MSYREQSQPTNRKAYMRLRKTAADKAAKHANRALSGLRSTHGALSRSVELLDDAAEQHLTTAEDHHIAAREHELLAEDARDEQARHARVRDRIGELLS